ncbi:MAG: hypothetical protein JO316_06830 [Abitibacteriaceae bacterium]|nr:hypothetical protein [Abditibacteriaceae bacterium]MBV9865047.1 hypothetical protein [Abditibacteriaceae bacterium]
MAKTPTSDPTLTNGTNDVSLEPDVSIQRGDGPLEASGLDVETADAVQTRATGRSVARATAGIVPLHILRFVIGFVAQPLIAHQTGLRWQADAYAVSTDMIQRIWLLFEKVLNPAFLPTFIGALKEEGEERAWRFTSTAFWLTAIALIFATGLFWWQMPLIVQIYSKKSANEQQQIELTIRLGRLLLTGLFFLGMSSLTYTILNGYKRFVVAALGDALWKIGVLGGAVIALLLHLRSDKAVEVFVMGFIAGAFLKLLPQVIAIGSKWKLLRPRIEWNDPLTRKMISLAIPLIAGIVVSEARGVYLQRLADDPKVAVEAGRAALKWSRIIGDNLIGIFPYALSIGIFPYLSDLARNRDRQPLTDTLMGALRICIFTFGPITAILIALKYPLLRAVWESGKMTQADTVQMSGPFVGFAIGLIGFACEMMLNQTFYAMTNAWIPTASGIIMTGLWIAIATVGVNMGWGLTAIAAAESISKTAKCLLMWFLLRPKLGDVKASQTLTFCFKVLCGSIFAAAVAWAVAQGIAPQSSHVGHFKIKMLLAVTAAGCSGLVIFIALGAVAGVQEVRDLLNFTGKLRRKLAQSASNSSRNRPASEWIEL